MVRNTKETFTESAEVVTQDQVEQLNTLGSQPEKLTSFGKLIRALQDPEVREAGGASIRTLLNIGISIADAFPGIGEAVSLTADTLKFSKHTDLTPDVSKKEAWATELLEIITLGTIPSHAYETIKQLYFDIPRFREGLRRLKTILSAEYSYDINNKEELGEAAATFGVTLEFV